MRGHGLKNNLQIKSFQYHTMTRAPHAICQIKQISNGGPVKRLALAEVPVETFMDAAQEVSGRVNEASSWDRPWRHATDQRIARSKLLAVLAVKRGPGMASAVIWHLNTQGHILWEDQGAE